MNKKIMLTIILLIIIVAAAVILLAGPKKPRQKIIVNTRELPELSSIPEVPLEIQEEARKKLSDIKIVSQYRYITDGQVIERSLNDTIKIFKDTKTDFIYQGWLTQFPLPDKCSDLSSGDEKKCDEAGYSAEYMASAISEIKKEMPDVIFSGGTQYEYFFPGEVMASSEEGQRDKAWGMALDPSKWGIKMTKNDAQCYWAKRWGFAQRGESCPSDATLKSSMRYYFPDATNKDFQKLFLSRIFRQIDAGADAIWIDMLYVQPALLEELTKDKNHPAIQESYAAIWDMVDKIHRYGYSKGKYIYVVTWVAGEKNGLVAIIPKSNIDIAMLSFQSNEIKDKTTGKIGQFDEKLWDDTIKQIREKLDLPIFVRIDYGGGGRTPYSVFSQELTISEAKEFLRMADDFLTKKGLTFIYPIHGGDMGIEGKVEKLSYGKYNWYDALAPEFDTFDTIMELAKKKSE